MNSKLAGRMVNDHAQRVTQLAFRRDLVPPIALIDGERVVSRFEKCELGPKPKSVHELPEYFRSFER
ncbi:MAG: hypothetical protein IPK70_11490 [Flavobacteriales bacterium]|jgi:hypothetical protein|nr:hypothetical protein [Flavobacteriales bacterium]